MFPSLSLHGAEPESPDGSQTFCWGVSFISLGLQSSFSSLRSSWIMKAVKYTNWFELNKINTFFVRTVADKKHKSKLSSQRWFKVKTHTHAPSRLHMHHTRRVSGKHVSQIVESKKYFAVSVTASATAKHTSLLSHLSPKRRRKERRKEMILSEWHNRSYRT